MAVQVPRTADITRTKSRDELVAEREWAQIAARRKNIASALTHSYIPGMSKKRAKKMTNFARSIKRGAWVNLAHETRSA